MRIPNQQATSVHTLTGVVVAAKGIHSVLSEFAWAPHHFAGGEVGTLIGLTTPVVAGVGVGISDYLVRKVNGDEHAAAKASATGVCTSVVTAAVAAAGGAAFGLGAVPGSLVGTVVGGVACGYLVDRFEDSFE